MRLFKFTIDIQITKLVLNSGNNKLLPPSTFFLSELWYGKRMVKYQSNTFFQKFGARHLRMDLCKSVLIEIKMFTLI